MSENLKLILLSIWLGVGLAVAIWTWIENSGVYYVYLDPPSPILSGLTWPVWLVILGIFWIIRALRRPRHPQGRC